MPLRARLMVSTSHLLTSSSGIRSALGLLVFRLKHSNLIRMSFTMMAVLVRMVVIELMYVNKKKLIPFTLMEFEGESGETSPEEQPID